MLSSFMRLEYRFSRSFMSHVIIGIRSIQTEANRFHFIGVFGVVDDSDKFFKIELLEKPFFKIKI